MNKFTLEMDKMEVTAEAWDDMVDIFDGDGVEEEADGVVDQVLDELGISVGAQMAGVDAPTSVFAIPRAASASAAPAAGNNSRLPANSASSSSSSTVAF